MYLCRAALQRFSSLSRHSMTHRVILHRDVVPRRLMSSVPGGTGENVMLVLLCGGAFAAAVTYAYRTVCSDSARFTERITEIAARPKSEGRTKPWPTKTTQDLTEVEPVEVKLEQPGKGLATPVVEEALVALVEETPVVEETPGVTEAVVAPAVVEVKPSPEVEEDTVSPVVQEVPDTPEVVKASVAPVIEEVTVTPVVQEAAVAPEVDEVTGVEEAPSVAPAATEGTKVAVPSESPVVSEATEATVVTAGSEAVKTTAPPAALDESESKHEYVVVVLEGDPKTEKKLKVLGVSPNGRIIPAPEDENPAELVTGQAPPA